MGALVVATRPLPCRPSGHMSVSGHQTAAGHQRSRSWAKNGVELLDGFEHNLVESQCCRRQGGFYVGEIQFKSGRYCTHDQGELR
jgi:hypothetical protein